MWHYANSLWQKLLKHLRWLVFLAMLLPSGIAAWHYREMPQFGEYHDDGIYLVTGKALAERGEYRIVSLPGEPWQTKYPPLYPALLAGVWKIWPVFPDNLRMLMVVAWAPLPVLLWLCYRLYGSAGLEEQANLMTTAALAINPVTTMLAISLRTEILFTAMLLAVFLWMDKHPWRAGLMGAALYLTRTAGIAILPAVVLVYVLRRRFRDAAIFAACMAPVIVGWMIWTHTHRTVTDDFALLYYLDYLRFGLYNQNSGNIHLFLWVNSFSAFKAAGHYLIMGVASNAAWLAALFVLSGLMYAGVLRDIRGRNRLRHVIGCYAVFAAIYILLLIVWHFPPDTRFMYPVLPLLLYGLVIELRRLAEVIRSSKRVERAFAYGLMALPAIGIAYVHLHFYREAFPKNMDGHRTRLASKDGVSRWMRESVPPAAGVYAIEDPAIYLYTGRPAMSIASPTRFLYENDRPALLRLHSRVAENAAERGLRYVLIDRSVSGSLTFEEQDRIYKNMRQDVRIRLLYDSGAMAVFEVANGED